MPSPRMSFPDDDEWGLCNEWCRPLHMVEAAIAGQPFAKYFRVGHFMTMGKLRRRPRPDIFLYKHEHTRMYLNLDASGHAYRYVAPPPDSRSSGQYRPHVDLVVAIDHLELDELPWLYGSGFDDERLGLSWEDRWDHPDVRARYERAAAREPHRRRRTRA